jgi:hypothetical protein
MSLLLALVVTAVSALVVDDNGAPLEGVLVAGIDTDRWAVTAADGRFQGSSSSPRLAFRRAGYQTVIVKPAEGMVIVLPPAAAPAIPRCRWRRNPAGTRFELPDGESQAFRDIDYNGRAYTVKTGTGTHMGTGRCGRRGRRPKFGCEIRLCTRKPGTQTASPKHAVPCPMALDGGSWAYSAKRSATRQKTPGQRENWTRFLTQPAWPSPIDTGYFLTGSSRSTLPSRRKTMRWACMAMSCSWVTRMMVLPAW